jgi:hypothetical protein
MPDLHIIPTPTREPRNSERTTHAHRDRPELAEGCRCPRSFPCRADKSPACPHGFRDASRDPAAILQLWHRFPGPLIGIATGAVSGVWVVDVSM